jgi:thiamine biosynthesis lipoprotein
MSRSRLPVILLLAVFAGACSNGNSTAYHDQFFAFGTLVDVTIYGAAPDLAAQASEVIENDFQTQHQAWHAWQPGKLTATNAMLAKLEPFRGDPAVLPVIAEANRLARLSNGLFNPVIGKLVALWGFHDNALPVGTLPDRQAIAALVAQAPAANDVVIRDGMVSNSNPAVEYDLGGFAKGYAIDRSMERLRTLGIENAIVNAGGDLRAIGRHGNRPWRVGIRHPRQEGILASVEIEGDASIFTSGDYERFFEVDGTRYHHILDPRSGYPADNATSVTVIHGTAATADAAATALFVAGPDHWAAVARSMGVELVMLVDTHGVIHMTPAMQQRIHFEPGLAPEIRISEPLS